LSVGEIAFGRSETEVPIGENGAQHEMKDDVPEKRPSVRFSCPTRLCDPGTLADLSFPIPLFGYASFKSGPLAIECSEAFQALEHLRSYGLNRPSCGCGHFARVDGYDIATLETRWTL
jgi:hypothetical protein